MHDPLDLASALIARPSLTPEDAGSQDFIVDVLAPLGFSCQRLPFGNVSNLWARRGEGAPLFVFAGHTDVVPAGDLKLWTSPPFVPTVRDGALYGRGAADMKGSIAAFLAAVERFLASHPEHQGSLALLITSDEEGPAVDGTTRVVEWLRARGEIPDFCLVGEPSCEEKLGDTIKNGRRGSLNGRLTVHGRQGHVAYPSRADNPIHRSLAALQALVAASWDEGDADFPPTSFQISNLSAGTGADNVIPGSLSVRFNFRFSPARGEQTLRAEVEAVLRRAGLRYDLEWTLSGQPFLTRAGTLLPALQESIRQETGLRAACATHGGTSDGRFIATLGTEVVEFGLRNATIHQIDEHVDVAELRQLARIYQGLLERLVR